MHCLVCKKAMMIREGKFGPFYYCPNGNHGTISVAKYEAIMEQVTVKDRLTTIDKHDALISAIEHQTVTLGGGVLSELEKFYIDNEAYYNDPNDFWQNMRPY